MKDGWEYKKLGEVCKVTMGQSPNGNSVNDTNGIEFHQGKVFFGEKYLNVSNSFTEQPSKIAEPNSVLLCVRAPVGTVNITPRRICIGRGLCSIKPNDIIIMPFLFYALTQKQAYFDKNSTGSTFKAISSKVVINTVLPIPPLAEQERIVAELDLLSSIIDKKKAQLKELDQLAQSIFYDMFGDPITNEKGWKVKKLGEACKLMAGGDVPRERFSKEKTKTYSVPVFSNGIENCGLYGYTDIPKITEKSITISGRGTIGFVAKRKEPFYPIIRLIVVTPINDIDITYLEYYAISMHFDGNGVAIPQLTVPMIKNVPIPLPPLPLQQEFASKIEAIERQKSLIQQSIVETQTLFDSRMEHWFN